jgi:hypothetical protein
MTQQEMLERAQKTLETAEKDLEHAKRHARHDGTEEWAAIAAAGGNIAVGWSQVAAGLFITEV